MVRLRPRESTWLDMLLAVERGCFVRTRPACVRREDSKKKMTRNHTRALHRHKVTNCLQPRIEEATEDDEKQLKREAEISRT